MLRLKRPKEPSNFSNRVRLAIANVDTAIANGADPTFPALWKEFKAEFADAQSGKCGYCETTVLAGHPGDVEHYAPKAAVWELYPDLKTWGTENPRTGSVVGRKRNELSPNRGYYWLAYKWSNYLLACNRCNRTWKGAFFPVAGNSRIIPPAPGASEKALLLNPFTGPKPDTHLVFDSAGVVSPTRRSKVGQETIKTLGLNRVTLVRSRAQVTARAFSLLTRISQGKTSERKREAMEDLWELGLPDRPYAGSVRAITFRHTGLRWTALKRALGK